MTPAQRLVLAAIDAVNAGDRGRIGELVGDRFADHGAGLAGLVGEGGVTYEVHDVFSVGDRVAVRATARGVRAGRPFAVASMHICRVDGGVLVEHWSVRDDLSLVRQVGGSGER